MLEKLQLIHLFCFIGFLILFGVLEYFFPLRKKTTSVKKRWSHNLGLSMINTIIARSFSSFTPVVVGMYIAYSGIGLFNIVSLNFVFEVIITVIILDFLIYIQHVIAHRWKWFWKLHQIHHSDKDLDVTTAVRFHTLEIVLSLFIKIFFVILLGLNPIAIVIFEIILVSSAMFNHSNLKLPNIIDKYLSLIIVTPEFHQVHHSTIQKQTDSNYGFFLSIWDRVFKTYTSHKFYVKKIGLDYSKKDLKFRDLILLDIEKK